MNPSHLLALAKTNAFLAGSGLVGAAGVGAVGFNSTGGFTAEQYQFTEDPLKGFERDFDTHGINNRDPNNIFGLKQGNCFTRFFPGATYAKPKRFNADKAGIDREPANMDLSADPIGCALIKLSQTTDKRAFVYKSEFSIKTETQGLSISAAFTNMKETGKVDYEFWITFLKRSGGH